MTKTGRIGNIILGIIMILLSVVMIILPEIGYVVAILILTISLIVYGIRCLVYYFTMSRYMVGGLSILFYGVIALDFGIFTGTLIQVPKIYIVMYLVATYVVAGAVSFLRGMEAKRYGAPSWKGRIIYGIINVTVAIVCLFFFRSEKVLVMIYSIGLIYAAVLRIFSSFRRTAIVYVQ